MKIQEATRRYEKWMAAHIRIVKPDLVYKHQRMSESPFFFMRATFYRWIQLWKDLCKSESRAPVLLAVGDLHIENFGTWRDAEGRLIWGVNDFDEAHPLPYTIDLVRLAASASLAVGCEHLTIRRREASDCILEGYRQGIAEGKPFVLGEENIFLRDIALSRLRDPVHFWTAMRKLPDFTREPPAEVAGALEHLLPVAGLPYRIKSRRAGLGSLGRQRLVALADWQGGLVAREAKSALPSACIWEEEGGPSDRVWYSEITAKAIRVPDPFVKLYGNWIVRRLAPDCSRIELPSLPEKRDEARILHAMGYETANIHLGSREAIKKVRSDLDKRPGRWLREASRTMVKALEKDWQDWREFTGAP
jgi:hypothetical protein